MDAFMIQGGDPLKNGRGGPGFSVLQVTDPYQPVHMFSIYFARLHLF